MSNIQLIINFWQHMNQRQWDHAKQLLDNNFVAEWPQSRVRFKGPNNFMMMNSSYPGSHEIKVMNVYECNYNVISEVEIKSQMPDGINLHLYALSFFEVHEKKILSAKEYWADIYDAPKWQEQWCERF